MTQKKLIIKIDSDIKQTLDFVCKKYTYKMDIFIEEALLDKFEEFEKAEDLENLRREPMRSLDEILEDIKPKF